LRKLEVSVEKKEFVAVAWLKGSKHTYYEDSFRMLSRDVPLVAKRERGEIFAVFDGIGSAPQGRHAAQEMAEYLVKFYREAETGHSGWRGLKRVLADANMTIHNWGNIPGTDKPKGGCAGTVVWLYSDGLHVFHAGDTLGLLIRDGLPIQITQTHQLDNGAIFRYFGLGETLNIDIECFKIEESDRILLLSDGVTKVFTAKEAVDLIEEYHDISMAVKTLVQRAQAMGSTDDITAMLVQVEEVWEPNM